MIACKEQTNLANVIDKYFRKSKSFKPIYNQDSTYYDIECIQDIKRHLKMQVELREHKYTQFPDIFDKRMLFLR